MIGISNRFFTFQGFRRPDLSGIPWGFWFGWRPECYGRDGEKRIEWYEGKFQQIRFKWKIGFYLYPWWKFGFGQYEVNDGGDVSWAPWWRHIGITTE